MIADPSSLFAAVRRLPPLDELDQIDPVLAEDRSTIILYVYANGTSDCLTLSFDLAARLASYAGFDRAEVLAELYAAIADPRRLLN